MTKGAITSLPAQTRARESSLLSRCRQLLRRILHRKHKSKMEVETSNQPVEEVPRSSESCDPKPADHDLPGPDHQPFRFLDLPKELRLMVYDLLVVVGKVFYTPDWYEVAEHCRFYKMLEYTVPSFDIFHVCKQIKEEAEDVYLSKNLFVLPYNYKKAPPISMWCQKHSLRPVFSSAGLDSIRNLSIAFCNRGSAPLIMMASDWEDVASEDGGGPVYADMSGAERQEYAHRRGKDFVRSHWKKNVKALKKIRASLDTLEIDLNNAYCPIGCCRDFNLINFSFLCQLKPNTIRLLGVRSYEEERLLTQMRMDTHDESGEEDFLDKNCKVVVNPTEDPWERYIDPATNSGRKKKICRW